MADLLGKVRHETVCGLPGYADFAVFVVRIIFEQVVVLPRVALKSLTDHRHSV